MANSRSSLLVPQDGESLHGGVTIEGQAIKKLSYKQLRKTLKYELKGLEMDMLQALRTLKPPKKRKRKKGKK